MQPSWPHAWSLTHSYYMASSASGQDEPNRALWLATRAGKMEPSCPLGTTRCIRHEKFPRKPYNKSFIDQVCSVKMVWYCPCSFFASCKCKCKCNLFTHGAPRSTKNSFKRGRAFPDRIGIWKCWFLRRGENRSTRRKASRSRVENQQQTQPTCPGIEPGTHWWEASALTTAPTLGRSTTDIKIPVHRSEKWKTF